MSDLSGKVAFVTGASGGIGRAVVRKLLHAGAKVAACDINSEALQEAVAGFTPDQVLPLTASVSDPAAVRGAVAATVSAFGSLNILCNIAGGSTPQDAIVTEAPEEEFWRVMSVDLFGTFLCCKYAMIEMMKAGGGSVINTTSIAALMTLPAHTCYTAAKGGLVAMTRLMATDYAQHGIRVNAIAPGRTLSPRVLERTQREGSATDKIGSRHLLGLVAPDDVANAVLFLASDNSRRITGHIMPVDSGATIA